MSSGIFDNSLTALIINELAGLSNSVCLPVIIFPFGSSRAITWTPFSLDLSKAALTTFK